MKQIHHIVQNWKLIISTIFLFILITCPSQGQVINLIPDPSFEDTFANVGILTHDALTTWTGLDTNNDFATRTAYMSLTQPEIALRLPETQWLYQYPRSGGGVVVMENFINPFVGGLHRTILRTRLRQKLVAGKQYYAKLYVVPGERFYSWFVDGISMYFDNGQLDTMLTVQKDSSGMYPNVVPQVLNPYGNVITDTVNWTKIEGCFVANGTEEFVTIGNFKSDSATAKLNNPAWVGSGSASCMLIDDVSVYAVDMQNWLPNAYGTINDSVLIGLPNYQIPDAKWYTLNMAYLGAGSQIKILATQPQQNYICAIEMCNTIVYDTFTVFAYPLAINTNLLLGNACLVYPNPTANTLHITNAKGLPKKLFSHTGQMVISTKDDMIDVSNFARGMYYLKCKEQVIKVIIE